jgi:hypothetical protein
VNDLPRGPSRGWADVLATALPWFAIAASWLLVIQYSGIDHDGLLYSFQTIARLHPELYAGDIYLRHGSQDDFSVFSSIYSMLVAWLGVESAAAWTTFVAQVALLAAAWLLARQLVPAWLAVLGLGLLIVMPGSYGAYGIFHVVETFITPRMPAEALGIGAFIAMLAGRRVLACVLLVGTACLHPLMAAPCVLIVVFLALPPGRRWMLPVAMLGGLVLLAVVGSTSLVEPLRIDEAWRDYFDGYAAYLFIENWRIRDWMVMCAPALTLTAGARLLDDARARQLCLATLLTGAAGLAVMAIGADWLRISLVVQGQGYRWFWPAMLCALLLLPAVAVRLWQTGVTGRAAVLILAAMWLSARESFGPMLALGAIVIMACALHDRLRPEYRRWLFIGALLALGIAAAASLADRVMVASNPFAESFAPGPADHLRYLSVGGLLPVLGLIAVMAIARRPAWRGAKIAATSLLLAACIVLAPSSHAEWSRRAFAPSHAAFEPWRRMIPPGNEVVWIDRPDAVWLLLDRPSYYSVQQNISGVFSRAAAAQVMSRESTLIPFMKADRSNEALSFVSESRRNEHEAARSLAEVCAAIDARFVIARTEFPEPPLAPAPAGAPAAYRAMKLYRCDPPST